MTRLQGSVLVALAGLSFSVGPVAFAGARETSTATQYLFYRCTSVAVVAVVFLVWRNRRGSFEALRGGGWQHPIAGLILGTMFLLFIAALSRTDAATTLFLQAAAPFATALIGFVVLRERVAVNTWIAMTVAAFGIAVMVATSLGGDDTAGILIAACIPVGIGFYTVLIRSKSSADPNIAMLVAGLFSAVVAGSLAIADGGLGVPIDDVGSAMLGGGVALGIGIPLYNIGSRVVPAAEMTLLLMTEVIFGPVWVWIWPGETPAPLTLVGGAIILTAVVWLAVSTQDEAAVPS